MAVSWPAKPANATYKFPWAVPLLGGDTIASYALVPSGVSVIVSSTDGRVIEAFVSGGTVGSTHSIAATVDTNNGETIKETIYLPIVSPDLALRPTAAEIAYFALRKIDGMGNIPSAEEMKDALEHLNDMLSEWKGQGANVSAALPLEASSEVAVADEFITAIKYNLLLRLCYNYDVEPTAAVAIAASRGLQLVKQALLPDERVGAEYF